MVTSIYQNVLSNDVTSGVLNLIYLAGTRLPWSLQGSRSLLGWVLYRRIEVGRAVEESQAADTEITESYIGVGIVIWDPVRASLGDPSCCCFCCDMTIVRGAGMTQSHRAFHTYTPQWTVVPRKSLQFLPRIVP